MRERFVTHRELALVLDVHEQTVSRWVRGENSPQPRHLKRIASYFGVPPGSLIEER